MIPVRTKIISALFALCIASVLVLPAAVSAEEHAIMSGDSYTVDFDLDMLDMFTYSWSSDVDLDFTVRDPNGDLYYSALDQDSYNGIIVAGLSGTYTMTWENNGLTTAHLEYDIAGAANEAENALSFVLWVVILAALIIVAIIVIVVVVVVMGKKKAPAQPAPGQQSPLAAQALATGHCPNCGTALDPNTSFCSRCGTKYK